MCFCCCRVRCNIYLWKLHDVADFEGWGRSSYHLINLTPVAASLCESGLSSRRFAQMDVAVSAHNDSLSVAKDGRNLEASRAFDIHKKRVGALNQSLQLVCAQVLLRRGV
jgi:hypothetical protein